MLRDRRAFRLSAPLPGRRACPASGFGALRIWAFRLRAVLLVVLGLSPALGSFDDLALHEAHHACTHAVTDAVGHDVADADPAGDEHRDPCDQPSCACSCCAHLRCLTPALSAPMSAAIGTFILLVPVPVEGSSRDLPRGIDHPPESLAG